MNKFINYLSLFIVVLLNNRTDAQTQGAVYLPDTSFKVFAYGNEKTIAFSGGFNNPQFSIADLNHDGKNDLVVFEKMGENVLTFINKGTAGNPDYRYDPHFALNFPKINSYLILVDYNCDGIPDLFQRGMPGFDVFKGYYNSSNELCFKHYQGLWYSTPTGWVNAYIDPNDIPGIADVDNDGDLDFFAFSILGAEINWYRNRRVEDNLPCDSIRVELKDKCWGRLYQGFSQTQQLHIYCPQFLPDGNPNGNEIQLPSSANKTTLHTGNNLCMFDFDGDGDIDYLNGGITYSNIQLLKNGRIDAGTSTDSIITQDTAWQTNGHIYNTPVYPAAHYVDYDGDGKKDILISPSSMTSSENYRCISFYKNTGTATAPVFTYKSDSLLSNITIDLGQGAYPVLFDYDRDGKPDLFVGGDGFFQQSSGNFRSKIAYYKNTSTQNNISFTLQSEDFLNLFAKNYRGAFPAIGDLNNDGKEDLIIAHIDGNLSYFQDTSTAINAAPSWVWVTDSLRDMNNALIDSTQFPAPFIYDVDTDGKQDLVFGAKSGWLFFYKNMGTAGNVQLKYITPKLGHAKADPWTNYVAYATPFIGKLDNTGNDYLLMGSSSGYLYRYKGIKGANATSTFTLLDSIYSYIDTFQSQYSGLRTVPAIADIDGDGHYDMILGNILGGLRLYKQVLTVGIGDEPQTFLPNVVLFPNPSKDNVTIIWEPAFSHNQQVTVSLYTITGQLISSQTVSQENQYTLDVKNLSSGVFQCILSSGENRKVLKIVKID
jgi:hypothetical protein